MYIQGLDYGATVAMTFSVCMCTCNYSARVLVCGVFVVKHETSPVAGLKLFH